MKCTFRFLSLFLLFAFWGQFSQVGAKTHPSQAVGMVVYVLQATGEKPGLNLPAFPQTVSVSMLESIVVNTENLQKRLERVYTYRNFTLLKTQKNLFLFSGKNNRISTFLYLREPNLAIGFKLNPPVDDQLPVLLKVSRGNTPLSKVSYFANFGKTIITGFPLPSAKSDSKTALFIAATYWKKEIQSAKDYAKIVYFYQSLNRYVPPSAEDKAVFEGINHFFNVHYGVKKYIPLAEILPKEILRQPPKKNKAGAFFVAYDVPPRPVGGFAAIQKNLIYPEHARKKNLQGTVVVHVLVGKDGRVLKTKILKSVNAELDSAAVRAIRKTKWQPALYKKDGKELPVTVWVSLPVVFRLKQTK